MADFSLWDLVPGGDPAGWIDRMPQKYGTKYDQPPLRSVDDPTPYKAFHDDHQAFPDSSTAYGPPGGGYPIGGATAGLLTRKR